MHTHFFVQISTKRMNTQGLHAVTVEARHCARHITDPFVDQRNFGRFAIVTKQLQVNVGQTCGRAKPHRPAQMGTKFLQTIHPDQRQTAQRQQLLRLGVGTEHRDVITHRILHQLVAWQRHPGRQTHGLDRTALGRAILQTLLHHPTRRLCGDLALNIIHRRWILP